MLLDAVRMNNGMEASVSVLLIMLLSMVMCVDLALQAVMPILKELFVYVMT